MALHFPVLVNGHMVGYVNIQRIAELAGGWMRYDVQVDYPIGVVARATVVHFYDDGATVLIIKALQAALDVEPVPRQYDDDATGTVPSGE